MYFFRTKLVAINQQHSKHTILSRNARQINDPCFRAKGGKTTTSRRSIIRETDVSWHHWGIPLPLKPPIHHNIMQYWGSKLRGALNRSALRRNTAYPRTTEVHFLYPGHKEVKRPSLPGPLTRTKAPWEVLEDKKTSEQHSAQSIFQPQKPVLNWLYSIYMYTGYVYATYYSLSNSSS